MDLQGLLHNRTTLIVGGVGAAAGVAVYLYRKRSGASSSSSTPAAAPAGYTAGGVGFDSSATDFAAQLGQAQTAWANTFSQFQTDVNARIAQTPTTGAPTTGPSRPTPPDHSSGGLVLTVPANQNLYQWSQQVEAANGIHTPVIYQLEQAGGVQWAAPSVYGTDPSQGNVPIFTTPRTVTLTR